MTALNPFHLAVPVHDLAEARKFYGELLGFKEGRSSERWIDYNFYGHQFVVHLKPKEEITSLHYNKVDGQEVPVPHFGVILGINDWSVLSEKLKKAGVKFIIEPYVRFAGEVGEQATMFLLDPSGNALEFKAFRDLDNLFAT